MDILGTLGGLVQDSGFAGFFAAGGWKNLIMIAVACVLLYLGIHKKFEPLLLVGIAFGALLTNIPGGGLYHMEMWDAYIYNCPYDAANQAILYNVEENRELTVEEYLVTLPDGAKEPDIIEEVSFTDIAHHGGLLDVLYIGVKAGVYPCLIFIGIGAMTDFGPLIARPSSLLLGAAAQLGVFLAFFAAVCLGFTGPEAGSIGIIGGADGPTAILTTSLLAPHLLGPIAIAAYSYMALIPMIQKPLMRALTTEKERKVKMEQARTVSKTEKIVFPIVVAVFVILLIPSTAPLIGCLMFGNLLKETGVTDRLSDTAQNALMNIVTLFLGISVGATTVASRFLSLETIKIVVLGVIAFMFSTVGGLLVGKLMYKLSGGKVNPLIGSAGVSAVPMAARVSQQVGQEADPSNFLLMHAMGPNVAGVIGSAIAAGFLIKVFG
ncbi:MAG: sodium ion-translocating decarboxylase subunit beta [Clostridiales bacterium]|nr:sodium ion-translocating decarboxylase subunit beta [Clostridiales bacterium]MDY4180433.1 sodium ion-translocating decarboxylase subunit beta [Pseudoflavonifractor sp.]